MRKIVRAILQVTAIPIEAIGWVPPVAYEPRGYRLSSRLHTSLA